MLKLAARQNNLAHLIEDRLMDVNIPSCPRSLYEPVKYSLSTGGKRIRPYLTLATCALFGGDPYEALPAARAIELLHNFTLLHDDIIDSADMRRGQPSVCQKWDSSTAILSGDAMYVFAFEQLNYYADNDTFSKEQYARISQIFTRTARGVCEGQAYDLEFEQQTDLSIEDYLYMIRGKTASMISGALKMGAAVTSVEASHNEILDEIGSEIGMAFQIQDDLLDVSSSYNNTGKKRGLDIIEGKKTYLSVLSLQKGNDRQKEFLRSVFRKKSVTEQEIEQVVDIYKTLGVLVQAAEAAKKRYQKVLLLLSNIENSKYNHDLQRFLAGLINREY